MFEEMKSLRLVTLAVGWAAPDGRESDGRAEGPRALERMGT